MAFGKQLRLQLSVIITLFLILGWGVGSANCEPLGPSQLAPGFTLPDLSGKMIALKDFKGRLVLVDFWATWCFPCRKSLPELVAIDRKYGRQGVTVLGLTVDDPDSFNNSYVKKFIDKYKVAYPVLRADPHVIEAYLGKEHPQIPALFIIDRNGRIAEKVVGFTNGRLVSTLEKMLSSQQTSSDN
jgi:peroxiredoxin